MKILVLMPLDEKTTYMAAGIYKDLTAHAKDLCLAMPTFMDYLVGTKVAPNWTYALFDTIVSAESVYKTAEAQKKDLIIIGNLPRKYKFDLIVNFQDLFESLPYEDKFVAKVKELVAGEQNLMDKLDLYENKDSTLSMHNCLATADFLSKYIETDPHLEDIEKEYKEKLEEWKKSQEPTILN